MDKLMSDEEIDKVNLKSGMVRIVQLNLQAKQAKLANKLAQDIETLKEALDESHERIAVMVGKIQVLESLAKQFFDWAKESEQALNTIGGK